MPYMMISVFKVTYLAVTGGKTEEDVTNNGGYIWRNDSTGMARSASVLSKTWSWQKLCLVSSSILVAFITV